MIKYSKEFFKKSFTADTMKSAYMLAVKWFSTNVLSKAEFVNVHVQYVKEDKTESPTVTVHLFAVHDGEAEVLEEHCRCCKEMHANFFINEDTNCNRCKILGFQKRLEGKANVKTEYYKELLAKYGGMD